MGTERAAVKTPVTSAEMLDALGEAWIATFNETPSRESVQVLLAQWALETGRGHAMIAFNVGGIKCQDDEHDFASYATEEVIGGVRRVISPPDPGCRFRAYATLADGCADYLALLHARFALAWPAVLAGDPAAFVHALKAQGYFTADVAQYTASVVSIFHEFATLPPASWEASCST